MFYYTAKIIVGKIGLNGEGINSGSDIDGISWKSANSFY